MEEEEHHRPTFERGRGGNDITGVQLLLLGWVAKGDALARENDVANARG